MGTFHQDKGELHGITVVVDTTGPKVYVGRCEVELPDRVVLNDADVHEDGAGGKTKADFIRFAAQFGFWKKFDHVAVPRTEIASVKRLGEVQAD